MDEDMFRDYLDAQKSEENGNLEKKKKKNRWRKKRKSKRNDDTDKDNNDLTEIPIKTSISDQIIEKMRNTPLPSKIDGGIFPGGAGMTFVEPAKKKIKSNTHAISAEIHTNSSNNKT